MAKGKRGIASCLKRGIIVMGLLGLLTGCSRVMDGPDMVYHATVDDYAGNWRTENLDMRLVIKDGKATLTSILLSEDITELLFEGEVKIGDDNALVPADEGQLLGCYSYLQKDNKLLVGVDAKTGREELFCRDRRDLSPTALSGYDGTWVTQEKGRKLEIADGKIKKYWYDEEKDKYELDCSGQAKLDDRTGELCEADDKGELVGYYSVQKRGNLLYAMTAIMDAPAVETVFAREEHMEDFPAQPVYAKTAQDVSSRKITRFTLSAAPFDKERDEFVFSQMEGCRGADRVKLSCWTSRVSGEKQALVRIWQKDEVQLQRQTPLSAEFEEKLADLLLSPEVLERNPYSDSSDMMCPTLHFTLEAEFESGESISVNTAYGIPIGAQKATEIVQLFLDMAE